MLSAWDPHSLVLCFFTSVSMSMLGWLFSWLFKVRITKVMFPVVFSALAGMSLLTYSLGGANHPRKTLITVLTVIHCIRMVGFLIFRSFNIRGEERGKNIKIPFRVLLMFACTAVVFVLPVVFCNSPLAPKGSIGPIEIVGTSILVLGMVIEGLADYQKFVFRNNPNNNGKWCSAGLYRYSRYPNYFGDLCVWVGIFLLSVPTLAGIKWIALLSPLLEFCVILKFDGVPKLEIVHEKRYGSNPGYVQYKKCTSTLIPCPTWLYRKLNVYE